MYTVVDWPLTAFSDALIESMTMSACSTQNWPLEGMALLVSSISVIESFGSTMMPQYQQPSPRLEGIPRLIFPDHEPLCVIEFATSEPIKTSFPADMDESLDR